MKGLPHPRRASATVPGVIALALLGCPEDLSPVYAAWARTSAELAERIHDASEQASALEQKSAASALPPDSDAEGLDLKAKLDAAVAGLRASVDDARKLHRDGASRVNELAAKGRPAPALAAIEQVKADVTAALAAAETKRALVESLLEATQRHEAARAAEAATTLAPPTVDTSTRGAVAYPNVRFTPGAATFDLGDAATKASLDALAAAVTSCKGLVVELEAGVPSTEDAKRDRALAAQRALALRRHLEAAGLRPSQVKRTSGVVGDVPVLLRVVTPCPAR